MTNITYDVPETHKLDAFGNIIVEKSEVLNQEVAIAEEELKKDDLVEVNLATRKAKKSKSKK